MLSIRSNYLGNSRFALPILMVLGAGATVLAVAPEWPRAISDAGLLWWAGQSEVRIAQPLPDEESRAFVSTVRAALGSQPATTLEPPTPRAAIEQLNSGDAQLALMPALALTELKDAARGATVLAEVGARAAHLITPADSPLRSFDMLSGTRVGIGKTGSAEDILARQLAKMVKLDPAPTYIAGHDLDLEQAFLDGEIDAALVLRAPGSPDIAALIATGYYRLLPLPANAATVWAMPGTRAATIPAQTYASPTVPELGSGTPTMGVPVYLMASANLSGAYVRKLAPALKAVLSENDTRSASSLPAGYAWHPAAVDLQRGDSAEIRQALATLPMRVTALFVLIGSAWLGVAVVRARKRAHHEALLFDLIRRSRALEAAIVSETNAAAIADARRQLAALDEEAEAAWLEGRLGASEVLLLRLGWGAELPERTADDIRARAEAMLSMDGTMHTDMGGKDSWLKRATAAAAAKRAESVARKQSIPPQEPVSPPQPKVTVRTVRREDNFEEDFAPTPPSVTPTPPARQREPEFEPAPVPTPVRPERSPDFAREREMVGFAPEDESPHATPRSSRFTQYTPIDTFQGNDEFGSGALLDTIRVRRSEDFDDVTPSRPAARESDSLPWRNEARQDKPTPAPVVRETVAPVPVRPAPDPVKPTPNPATTAPAKPVLPATSAPKAVAPASTPAPLSPPTAPPASPAAATPAMAAPSDAAAKSPEAASSKPVAAQPTAKLDPRSPAAKQATAPKDRSPRAPKQRGKQTNDKVEPAATDAANSPPANTATTHSDSAPKPAEAKPEANTKPDKPQLPLF